MTGAIVPEAGERLLAEKERENDSLILMVFFLDDGVGFAATRRTLLLMRRRGFCTRGDTILDRTVRDWGPKVKRVACGGWNHFFCLRLWDRTKKL